MSIGGRIIALALGVGVLALAYWMFTNYAMFDGTDVARGRHALLKWVVSVAWSRPVAVVFGLVGLLIAFTGVVGGKGDDTEPGAAKTETPKHPAINTAPSVLTATATPPATSSAIEAPPGAHGDPAVAVQLERLRRGEQDAQPAFWGALFALPQWHFYSSKPMEKILGENDTSPPLFIGVVDGRPMLHVFSSEAAARVFGAERHRAQGRGGDGITLLTMPPEAALEYIWRLPPEVEAIIIDSAFFGARTNLPWLYAISKSIPLDEACRRLNIDPADEMARPAAAQP